MYVLQVDNQDYSSSLLFGLVKGGLPTTFLTVPLTTGLMTIVGWTTI